MSFRIRDAVVDDAPALASLHVRTIRETHGGFQGSGLGLRLVGRVAERFLAIGAHSMLLFGDARNPSNRSYERLRAERLHSPSGEFRGGYGWPDLTAVAKQSAAE